MEERRPSQDVGDRNGPTIGFSQVTHHVDNRRDQ